MARDRDEGIVRFVHAQYGDMTRRLASEAFAGQHNAGLGRGQRRREFAVLDEGKVAWLGVIDGRDAGHATTEIGACGRLRTGQRGDIRHAQPFRHWKKTELGQRLSPANTIARSDCFPKPKARIPSESAGCEMAIGARSNRMDGWNRPSATSAWFRRPMAVESDTALAVARGTARLLRSLGFACISELALPSAGAPIWWR